MERAAGLSAILPFIPEPHPALKDGARKYGLLQYQPITTQIPVLNCPALKDGARKYGLLQYQPITTQIPVLNCPVL